MDDEQDLDGTYTHSLTLHGDGAVNCLQFWKNGTMLVSGCKTLYSAASVPFLMATFRQLTTSLFGPGTLQLLSVCSVRPFLVAVKSLSLMLLKTPLPLYP